MCGRYVLPEEASWTRFVGSLSQRKLRRSITPYAARYNVAPSQNVPAPIAPPIDQWLIDTRTLNG
jgi:putative SOS response-associated peptidase YedK